MKERGGGGQKRGRKGESEGEGGRGRERNFVIEIVVPHGCTVCN